LGAIIVAVLLSADSVHAAPKQQPPKYKVGDRAVWEFAGKEHPGTVESIDRNNGWITLKLDDGEFGGSQRGPATKFRKLAKKKPKPAGREENPFETVEERANKDGPRSWSDQTGKFKIEASLVKVEDEVVTLLRKDGKEVELPLGKLSEKDQEFLQSVTANTAEDGGVDDEGFDRVNVDGSRARPLDISRGGSWSYAPDVASARAIPDTRIALGPKAFHEKPFQVFVSPEKDKGVVVWLDSFQGKKARVQSCDLKRDRVEKTAEFAPGQTPIAISADMRTVVAFKIAERERGDLFLYDLDGQKLKPRFTWSPFGNAEKKDQNILAGRFIDKDHLLTINTDGNYALWDLSAKVRPIWQSLTTANKKPALSANSKYLATTVDGGIVIIETLSGKKAGFIVADDRQNGLLAFDPAGRQLVLVLHGQVRVWDLTTREQTYDFACDCPAFDQVVWADESTLLVDGKTVIDVPHRVKTWTYTGTPVGLFAGGRYLYVEDDNKNCVLASGTVPNDEARMLVKSTSADELLAIKPGDAIALDVQMGAYQQSHDKVVAGLKKSLEANGMRVDDNSNIKLVVTVKPGEVKQMVSRTLGRGMATQQLSVPTQLTSLTFQINGTPVWSGGGEITPRLVRSNQNETVEAAIQRQINESIANMGNTKIPKYVANLPADKVAGTSKAP
jgi:WD40 repeat protein